MRDAARFPPLRSLYTPATMMQQLNAPHVICDPVFSKHTRKRRRRERQRRMRWSFPLLVGLLHTVGQQVLQHRVGPERSSTDHRVGLLPGNDQELALKDLAQITKLAYCRETTRSWPESSKNSEGRSPPTPPEVQFLLVCGAGTPPVAVTSVLAWRCECGTGGVRVGAGPKT